MRVSTVLPVLTLVCLWGWPGVQAAEAPDHADNVIVVTMDGFRHQEFFGGAELRLMDKKSGGVRDVDDLKKEFWRDSPQARRETLLPFIWGTLARTGQIFGDRGSSASARCATGRRPAPTVRGCVRRRSRRPGSRSGGATPTTGSR